MARSAKRSLLQRFQIENFKKEQYAFSGPFLRFSGPYKQGIIAAHRTANLVKTEGKGH